MGERTEEKMNRINRFHKSLTTSLRKNKGNVETLFHQGSFKILPTRIVSKLISYASLTAT